MRPVFALLVFVGILGGTQAYMKMRPRRSTQSVYVPVTQAQGEFDAELDITFAAGPDEFSTDEGDAASLEVQFQGASLLRRTDAIAPGESLRIEGIQGVVPGDNEFYVQASPQDTSVQVPRALRFRILRNDVVIGESVLWSEPIDHVHGTLTVTVPEWALENE